ncbi:hypothetical protein Chor_004843, partial [Crotalus horridus]
ELVLELELERRRGLPRGCETREHFLLQVFRERLLALGTGAALGARLLRQQELLSQTRILLRLPPSVLVATQKKGGKIVLACEGFFSFVNTELHFTALPVDSKAGTNSSTAANYGFIRGQTHLKCTVFDLCPEFWSRRNSCSRGCSLPYDITAHFFRGLLSTSVECSHPGQEVTAVLSSCQTRCPILLCSAVRWWPRLEFVLCSQWKRLFSAPLAQGLQSLKDLQSSLQSCLSSEATSPPSNTMWVSAAFLHFAAQQQADREGKGEVLKRLGPKAEQFLSYVLFFSVMDFISAKVAPEASSASILAGWDGEMMEGQVTVKPTLA